jgi:hypothetical protein
VGEGCGGWKEAAAIIFDRLLIAPSANIHSIIIYAPHLDAYLVV